MQKNKNLPIKAPSTYQENKPEPSKEVETTKNNMINNKTSYPSYVREPPGNMIVRDGNNGNNGNNNKSFNKENNQNRVYSSISVVSPETKYQQNDQRSISTGRGGTSNSSTISSPYQHHQQIQFRSHGQQYNNEQKEEPKLLMPSVGSTPPKPIPINQTSNLYEQQYQVKIEGNGDLGDIGLNQSPLQQVSYGATFVGLSPQAIPKDQQQQPHYVN